MPAGSGLEWRWNPGGPRSFRLVEVERDLREAGVILLDESADPFAGRREWTIHLVDVPRTVVSVEFAVIMQPFWPTTGDSQRASCVISLRAGSPPPVGRA